MPPTAEVSANPTLATLPLYLVYDGSCGFCSRAVQFILRHERRHDLLFVPRESLRGRSFRSHFHLEAVESMLWIAGSQVKTESDAVLSAAKYLGGVWAMLAAIASLIPASIRNWGYRFIARNRRRLSASAPSCLLPTAEQRTRFLG
jgi:predicted DCC family thiol-disulfide oxidoreductase YuxK